MKINYNWLILKSDTTNIEQKSDTTNRCSHLKFITGHIPYGETPPGKANSCSDLVGEIA
jgi:hypothetical protein